MITRRRFLKSTASGGASFALFAIGCSKSSDFDLILRQGLVCDGKGNEIIQSDVGVSGGRITAIGDLSSKKARQTISAKNRIISPGFIDIHSHSDVRLLVDGNAQSKIRQGVTTEIVGQDGGSVAPLNAEMRASQRESLLKSYGIDGDWENFSQYFKQIRAQGVSVNLATMVGAGTLRKYVIGYENRPATPEELQEMQKLLQLSLEQGARHISTGLEYTPGSFASQDELTQLCRILPNDQVYASHMRNEDDALEEAVEEAIQIAKNGGVRLNISHLKAQGQRNWHRLDSVLERMEKARQAGMQVTCDRYPYVAYSTGLSNLFPLWARENGGDAFVERLNNPEFDSQIRQYVDSKITSLGSWNSVLISSLSGAENKAFEGKRLGEVAAELNQGPYNFLKKLVISQNGGGGMVGFGMSEENTSRLLAHPFTIVASDGSARAVEGPLAKGSPHPRNFGTFPRVLGRYVREQKIMSLEEAVRKMTSLPAQVMGIKNRGVIEVGAWADLVVFDPDTVIDKATFNEPKQYPEGIDSVIVNGVPVFHDGQHSGNKPGKILI